jgi:hypothetical protein
MPQLNNKLSTISNVENKFDCFLQEWDEAYNKRTKNINLFNTDLTQNWTKDQKVHFAKIFYHARGHFHDFLWYLGNHAESKCVKDMVLKNIAEEMNGAARSHEQLYIDFADSIGADLENELVEEESYLDSIKQFNKGHLKWLQANDNDSRVSAFSAYERLDNIDYDALMRLVESLNVDKKGQLFFKIHTRVQHFETTEDELKVIWQDDPQKVKKAFSFIADHQIKMWNDISDSVFALNLTK